MSILSTLKSQSNSIDDLAKLPQAMIMQMAQKGQIREDMLAPILARKAELAQAVANTRALQQQQGAPAPQTVMEQIMNQNALAEVPASPRDVGVAQLPLREDMYAPQRMAGGGIVAFQNNENQPIYEGMPERELTEEERRYLEMNPYMQRSRAVANFGREVKEAFTNPSNYNPVSLYQRYVGQPFSEAANRFINADMNKTFRTGQQARTGEIPMFVGNDLTTKGKMVAEGRMKPNENVVNVMKKEREQQALNKDFENFDKATALFEQEQKAKLAGKSGNVPAKIQEPKAPTQKPVVQEEPLYSKYEKMLMDEREAAKGAREEAKWSRMLEAGLGILGGDSPYAMVNIGKGAAPGLKGYGEDIKALRGEERGRVKELLGIEGMRQEAKRFGEEMGIKKQMLEVQRMAASKPDQTSQIIGLGRKSGMSDREIMGILSGAAKDPDISARNIAMKAFYESPVLQAQYKNDINAFLKAQGIGAGAGGQAPLNYIPGQGLK
jgi:hypothetical protein